MMEKILSDADSRRRPYVRTSKNGFERVECKDWRGKIVWIQENTERDYSQRKYVKNALVVGDRDDNSRERTTLGEGRY